MLRPGQTTPEAALSEAWLASTDRTLAFYQSLRDEFAPDKPMWLTETAETACGGNPWASTFLDTFRYLDQLGRLAKAGVQMVAHNTLAASDYGLLDENDVAAAAKLLGGGALAQADRHHCSRRRRAPWDAPLRALPARRARGRHVAGHQYGQNGCRNLAIARLQRALHAVGG
jgi:hypothetical protein